MTENNKPIMIDGADVSKCKHFHCNECLNLEETVSACEYNSFCLFKQLTRKIQECEHWKRQAELGSDTTDRFAKQLEEKTQECERLKNERTLDLVKQLDQLETEKEQAEQKIKRIEEIAEYEFKELMNAEDYHNMTEVLKQILQIIEEA